MKKETMLEALAFTARISLGVLFVFASIEKLASPEAFAQSILNYRIISNTFLVGLVAIILPWTELVAGCGLILNVHRKGSAFVITMCLLIFIIAITQGIIRNLDISCGCFTQDPLAAKIGVSKLVEDVILTALAVFTLFAPARPRIE